MLRTFASVSAFQIIGMVSTKENVDRVKSVQVEVMLRNWTRVEGELVCFGRSGGCVGGEVEVDGSWRESQ
jgi:hypothetical protein